MRVVGVFIVWNILSLPARIAFRTRGDMQGFTSPLFYLIDFTGDIIFWIDIILAHFTQFFRNGMLVEDFSECRKRYHSGWFLIDFPASFPVDLGFIGFAPHIYAAARLPRFLWIFRLSTYFTTWESYSNFPNGTRIGKLFLAFFSIVHYVACLFYTIAAAEGFPDRSVAAGFINGNWYLFERRDLDPSVGDFTVYEVYSRCLYWALTIMTGQGADPQTPATPRELWFTMFCVLTGLIVFAAVIGQVWTLISTLNEQQEAIRKKKDAFNSFMQYRKFPKRLKKRIRDYFEYLQGGHGGDDEEILSELPAHLRADVYLHLNRKIIMAVPFFKGCPYGFVKTLAIKLKPILFAPEDVIIRIGDIGREMYFISQGVVRIIASDGSIVGRIGGGNFFGEVALLSSNSRRTASIVAESYVNAYILTASDLYDVLRDYPDVEERIRAVGEVRQQRTANIARPDRSSSTLSTTKGAAGTRSKNRKSKKPGKDE